MPCGAVACENRTSGGVKFFSTPAGSHPIQQNRRRLWLETLKHGRLERQGWQDFQL